MTLTDEVKQTWFPKPTIPDEFTINARALIRELKRFRRVIVQVGGFGDRWEVGALFDDRAQYVCKAFE